MPTAILIKKAHIPTLVLFVCLLTGCVVKEVTAPLSSTSINRDVESFAEFKDIPYPANMNFRKEESFTYSRRGVLSGLVVVTGRMNSDELGAYYDRHLPTHGWSPVAEVSYNASIATTWQKGKRTLTIIGRPMSLSVTPDIRVEIWVAPPHTKEDLGNRTIYQKSTVKEPASKGGNILDSLLGGSKGGKVQEEDL